MTKPRASSPPDPQPDPLPRESLWGGGRRAVSIALLVTIGLSAFEGLAVAAALPELTAELGGVSLAPWVLTAYLIASAVATLAAGPVVDQRGVRVTFQAALAIFVAASVACALSPTMELLIAARIVQGIGGGALLSVAVATVGLAFPPDLRAGQYAAQSAVWGTMSVLGPALAALFLGTIGWEGVFWINLPLGVGVAWIGYRTLPALEPSSTDKNTTDKSTTDKSTTGKNTTDVGGLILATVFITTFIAALSAVSIRSAGLAAVAVLSATLWWFHAGRRSEPLIQRRHLLGPPYSLMGLAVGFALAAAVGLNVILPVVLRAGLNRSSGQAAFSLLFFSMSWTIGAQVASRALRRIPGPTVALYGFAVMIAGTLAGSLLGDQPAYTALMATAAVRGLGIGIISIPYLTELQRFATADDGGFGRINAAHQFYRFVGVIVSVAVTSAILLFTVDRRIGDVEAVRSLLGGETPPGEASTDLRRAIAAGYRWAQVAATALGLIGVALAFATRNWLSRHPTSDRALQEAQIAGREVGEIGEGPIEL